MQQYRVVFLDSSRNVSGTYGFEAGVEPDADQMIEHLWKTFKGECAGLELRHQDRVIAQRFEPLQEVTPDQDRRPRQRWRLMPVFAAGAAVVLLAAGLYLRYEGELLSAFPKAEMLGARLAQPKATADHQALSHHSTATSDEATRGRSQTQCPERLMQCACKTGVRPDRR